MMLLSCLLFLLPFAALGALIVGKNIRLGGESFTETTTTESATSTLVKKTLAAAKTGVLTVRTDANTGSITGQAAHGVTTGARLDVFWDVAGVKGHRRGMLVGTVAGLVIPIDLGTGDDLPAAASNLTIMVPTQVEVKLTGNNVQGVAYGTTAKGIVVIADATNVELDAKVFRAAGSDAWSVNDTDVNPLAGDVVDRVFLSHGDSTASRIVKVAFAVN